MKETGTILICLSAVLLAIGTFALVAGSPAWMGFVGVAAYLFPCGIMLFGFGTLAPPKAAIPHKTRPVMGAANGRLIAKRAQARNEQEASGFLDSFP